MIPENKSQVLPKKDMYCRNCGKEIADGSMYCSYCGAKQTTEKQNDYLAAADYLRKAGEKLNANECTEAAQMLRIAADCLTRYILVDLAGFQGDVQLIDRINILRNNGVFSEEEAEILHRIRKAGNISIHEGSASASAEELRYYLDASLQIAGSLNERDIPQIRNNKVDIELDDRLYNEGLEYLREYCEGTLAALQSASQAGLGPNFRQMVESLFDLALYGYNFETAVSNEDKLNYIANHKIYNERSIELLRHSLSLLRANNKTLYPQYAEAVLRDIPNMFDSYVEFNQRRPETIYRDNSPRGVNALFLYLTIKVCVFAIVLCAGLAVFFVGTLFFGGQDFSFSGLVLCIGIILIAGFIMKTTCETHREYLGEISSIITTLFFKK